MQPVPVRLHVSEKALQTSDGVRMSLCEKVRVERSTISSPGQGFIERDTVVPSLRGCCEVHRLSAHRRTARRFAQGETTHPSCIYLKS